MNRVWVIVAAAVAGCGGVAQRPPAQPSLAGAPVAATPRAAVVDAGWGPLGSLTGSWQGVSEDGESKGTLTIAPDLEGKVLVRRGTNDSPRGHHEDLTVISRAGSGFRADYFDNEGHVIRYSVASSADGKEVTFLSDEVQGAPRFRLTYDRTAADDLSIVFEIAPAGGTEFKRFTAGVVHRH